MFLKWFAKENRWKIEIEERTNRFSSVLAEFEECQSQIEELCEGVEELEERENFECEYFQILGKAKFCCKTILISTDKQM